MPTQVTFNPQDLDSTNPALAAPAAAHSDVLPSGLWRSMSVPWTRRRLPQHADVAWDIGLGKLHLSVPRRWLLLRRAAKIVAMEGQLINLSRARLCDELETMRELFRRGRERKSDVDRALALIREVAAREMGQRPYLVQVAASLGLAGGHFVEMATGEGKTLTAVLPAVLAGWRGRGCHVITVNDYLARRDAQWMKPVYDCCGVSVASIDQDTPPEKRRAAYLADITYATNKEIAADFLRDRLRLGRHRRLSDVLLASIGTSANPGGGLLMRGLEHAIVDEADSVLIDEAVTPLIISGDGPNPAQTRAYETACELTGNLEADVHYQVDHRYREVRLTAAGQDQLDQAAAGLNGDKGLFAGRRRREELAEQALTARELFLKDKHYVIQEGAVVIIDEFTGRLMPDRTWREGLHQAIEAKEKLTVNPPKDTFARISFQRFFRLYRHLSGMTGTAREESMELWRTYHRPTVAIPTHRPCIRRYNPPRYFDRAAEKWAAIVKEIVEIHRSGRPILIGTCSVTASEHLSGLLEKQGIDHQVLNAVRHEQEAQIVAQAGRRGAVTVATNMAGRGTDIKLDKQEIELGGLHVIATEYNEAARVDRQLFGRCARQGNPGTVSLFASREDELIRRFKPRVARRLARQQKRKAGKTARRPGRRLFRSAQNRAEGYARRQRSQVLRNDDWLEESLGFAGAED